ncbi:hypothetical protein BRD17_02420 [Halobacteriales archaeon SW_7_68_16]|nr:MAG: hypothetical protein BRD17_02420 [Halobacteriales archaeon SW_7_68_16]
MVQPSDPIVYSTLFGLFGVGQLLSLLGWYQLLTADAIDQDRDRRGRRRAWRGKVLRALSLLGLGALATQFPAPYPLWWLGPMVLAVLVV